MPREYLPPDTVVTCDCGAVLASDAERAAHSAETGHRDGTLSQRSAVRNYRCKHAVEAMRWTDTDEAREVIAAWFKARGAAFETRGPIALLPDLRNSGYTYDVTPGEWIVFMDGEFVAMEDDQFTDTYEEVR